MESNQLVISGVVLELQALRVTPGGVPIRTLLLEHRSRQVEVGTPREVFCRIKVEIRGPDLQAVIESLQVGSRITVTGFLARSGYKDDEGIRLNLHAQHIE
ncbi:primosomal replication protein N [Gammaproteobacteria bacterium 45_16_T64]|nr:primosomal replication protein N [Gammaproteobacteria bacterium 45_16_T64]